MRFYSYILRNLWFRSMRRRAKSVDASRKEDSDSKRPPPPRPPPPAGSISKPQLESATGLKQSDLSEVSDEPSLQFGMTGVKLSPSLMRTQAASVQGRLTHCAKWTMHTPVWVLMTRFC